MLPARFRMRHGDEFGAAISAGARSSTRRVVVHFSTGATRADSARVGFVVSKAVGGAVQRNLVKRRLRAAMAEDLPELPDTAAVVVRALPAASGSTFAELRGDLRHSWRRAQEKDLRRRGASSVPQSDRQPVR
ncbi:ribonuclease P protein component [Ruania zhangjianzhongii]|uniref:ribonuclease P protein component n=1 Tax=Ruania zhangjianzhongii TaxID=2603206 RepID=UPI0011CAE54D|nr:ribonuclease P protein component [Ruania zhangjianzhongii]